MNLSKLVADDVPLFLALLKARAVVWTLLGGALVL